MLNVVAVEVFEPFQDACDDVSHIGQHHVCPGVGINRIIDSRQAHEGACFQDRAQVI